ncbi:peptidyl-prolyl cis-trans isomerase D [Flavobacteriaceae bacterium MAR_2010_72]|nr:peptidyl-prolyl cis-trans isomerase D [Flavobacteriaceae bacterium MAR_2010_72]TVZ57836.1 peptidyl-prolyl cis-trans isomerase D [Flavobacteriaceae bacterium MAR_2010_105]
MAVLNKIRQRSLFLILIIALALFSFVLTDLFKNSDALFGGPQDIVATVNGKDIGREEFMNSVDVMQRQLGPSSTSTQAMNNVYDQEVRQAIMETQFEKLGLSVEQDQMRNLIRTNFSSFPEFNNEDGIFDEAKMNEFIANLKATSPQRSQIGGSLINYADWVSNEQSIAANAMQQTYNNMIKAGLTATVVEGEMDYVMENKLVDLKYVVVPYTSIADSLVQVTKSDITKYINENKKKYEVEASRDINFVQFNEVASVEDEEALKNSLIALLDNSVVYNAETKRNDTIIGFRATKDPENFVNANSDIKYNGNYVFKSGLPDAVADSIFKLNVGEFYGPYKEGEYYKLTKVVAQTQLADSAKVRHILIPFVGATRVDPSITTTEVEAKKTADSILAAITSKRSKFVDLLDLSSDKVSNEKEGVIEFAYTDSFAPEFRNFSFENNKGDIDVVRTSFGFHIIEILDQQNKSRAIKIASLARKIEPSEETVDNVFNETSKFELAIQDKDFQVVAEENGYEVRPVNTIKELQENIPGLGSQRTIVRWAFEAGTNVGDYKRFSIPTGGYVVVQLAAINKEGLMSPENASVTAIPAIRKQKKAKLIREKISATILDEVAKNQNVTVSTAAAVNMKTPTLSGAGQEPKVVGTAFGLKQGQTSKLVDGNTGVFMVEVTKVTEAPKLENYQANTLRLSAARVNSAQTKLYNALKEAAEIKDNRAKFY